MTLRSIDHRTNFFAVAGALFAVATSVCDLRADGLLAAWEFEPGDLAGNDVSATAGGAANTTGLLVGGAAIVDGALELDGIDDYLEFGNDLTDLRQAGASMTIAAWVRTNSEVTSVRRIVEHEDNTYFWAEGNIFRYTTHGTTGGALSQAQSFTAPEVGVWQHVAVTFSGGAPARIYINGGLEGTSGSNQAPIPNNMHTFQIGARRSASGPATNFWDGAVDDVALWDCELFAADLEQLAGVGAGGYAGRVVPTALELDTDGDGMPNAYENQFAFLNPNDPADASLDEDGDGLSNLEEFQRGTLPDATDTDGDTLSDGDEVNLHGSDPLLIDTDGDFLDDDVEVLVHMTDPASRDTDSDGLEDGDEIDFFMTNPNSDDTDGDGFKDGVEIAAGTDPDDDQSFPSVNVLDGLFVYYTFDSADVAGDTVRDRAGDPAGPFDGTKMNGGPNTVAGLFGDGAEFGGGANNGDWEHVSLDAHAAALAALTEGTIAAWIRVPDEGLTTNVLTIFAISDEFDGSSETRFWVSVRDGTFGSGTLAYGVRNDGANLGSLDSGAVNPLIDGGWHHAAVSFSQSEFTAQLYIDGLPAGAAASAFFSEVLGANSAAVGRNKDDTAGGGQWFFDGTMDDFAIWGRALNAAEISEIFDQGLAGNPLLPPGGGPALRITNVSRDPGTGAVSLTFDSTPGKQYALDFSADLANWDEGVDDVIATGTSTTFMDSFAHMGGALGFYRVRQLD